jgi:polar amino acid transport system permease protein
LLALALVAVLIGWRVATDALWRDIAARLLDGLGLTLLVTSIAFPLALGIGLFSALGLVSGNLFFRQFSTLYVQVVRGLPVLVQIFIVAFVLVPLGVETANFLGFRIAAQDVPMVVRVIAALAFAYGAFEAETLRGGLTSLPRGQAEAARALGLSRRQTLRHILLPQTFRRVLPTLGNDLICLLKDSALVSVLGVRDITQEARLYQSATFRYTESLVLLAFYYLALTLLVALGVRALENRYRRHAA